MDSYETVNVVGSATKYQPAYDGGLLYYDIFLENNSPWDDASRIRLFDKTSSLIKELYTSDFSRVPYAVPMETNVKNVNISVLGSSEAQDRIWNHIKNKREPVVVVMDSEQTGDLYNKKIPVSGMSSNPVLHYNVIVGIKEDSTGKYFVVNDPWVHRQYGSGEHRIYNATDYINSMCVNPNVTPIWIYHYADNHHTGNWYDRGCYVMLVNE